MANGDDGWRGGTLYASLDDSRYTLQGRIEDRGVFGVCNNILGYVLDYSIVDRINTITVVLTGDLVAMESVTDVDLNNGLNKALVGNEIIQFQNAIENADGSWTLSTLRRGIRGTEKAIAGHEESERFVLLSGDDAVIEVLPSIVPRVGTTIYFKMVSPGQELSRIPAISMEIEGKAFRPYAPTNLVASIKTTGDIAITWTRRDRRAGD